MQALILQGATLTALDLAQVRFEENLSSPIHRRPDEIMPNIFILGRLRSIYTSISYCDGDDLHKYPTPLGPHASCGDRLCEAHHSLRAYEIS